MRCAVTAFPALLALAASAWSAPPAAASALAGNAIQQENALAGDSGWEVPRSSGQTIAAFASEASVLPGQAVHLHVYAPRADRYRILIYRLGWYGGSGGRLLMCLPGCSASRATVPQYPPTRPAAGTNYFYAPWSVTDSVPIPDNAVSGYYEAKLEVVSGPDAGAIGSVPWIVREALPRAAILIQVPVNTWQAYNRWGGESLYGTGSAHAVQVSFDRPYDSQVFHDMVLALELPWVRYLERTGADVSYQTDIDTDSAPSSLLAHRLVFAIGHDEYWTQAMRVAFMAARRRGTNLMFGSNAELWRIRYERERRVIDEWRNPFADPVAQWQYDTGEFRQFNEPECRLMAVEYRNYAQRWLLAPPTDYTVVGPANDPWLAAAALQPGSVVPQVVGYEWDSLVPGCFKGRVVQLMHGSFPGSDGVPQSADMVRATATSGARVLAMGTMEFGWALDGFTGQAPNPSAQAFAAAALADLTTPAPPAHLRFRRVGSTLRVLARLRGDDPRVLRVSVQRRDSRAGCADALHSRCVLPAARRRSTYLAFAVDPWGQSAPLVVRR